MRVSFARRKRRQILTTRSRGKRTFDVAWFQEQSFQEASGTTARPDVRQLQRRHSTSTSPTSFHFAVSNPVSDFGIGIIPITRRMVPSRTDSKRLIGFMFCQKCTNNGTFQKIVLNLNNLVGPSPILAIGVYVWARFGASVRPRSIRRGPEISADAREMRTRAVLPHLHTSQLYSSDYKLTITYFWLFVSDGRHFFEDLFSAWRARGAVAGLRHYSRVILSLKFGR